MIAHLSEWLEHEYQTDASSMAAVRMFYALFLLVVVLPRWLWVSALPASFYQPPLGLASLFAAPPPAWVFYALNVILITAAVGLLCGRCITAASIVIPIGLVIGNSFGYAFGKIDHDWLLLVVPLVGVAAGWGRHRVVCWPIALLAVIIAFAMFYGGSTKVLTGWLEVDRLAVRTFVVDNALANDRANGVAQWAVRTWPAFLWESLDWSVVIFECGFLVAVLRRRWFVAMCAIATIFHLSNAVMMELQFASNFPAYAMVGHWSMISLKLSRARVLAIAVATCALYLVVGNPAWLLSDAMGWEPNTAVQWPFTVLAFGVAAVWFARDGVFLISRTAPPLAGDEPIVLFDGYCGLCNDWVNLLIRHDRRAVLRFLPLQTDTGAVMLSRAGLAPAYVDSILLAYRGRVYTHSSAVLLALWLTRSPLRMTALCLMIPAVVRDAVYRFIAAHRYAWFGRSDTCRVPTPNERQRFLTGNDAA